MLQLGFQTPSWEIARSNFTFSLSPFRLWIPQVRGQPHGFFFSSRLDPLCPLVWSSGWWDLARWYLSIYSIWSNSCGNSWQVSYTHICFSGSKWYV